MGQSAQTTHSDPSLPIRQMQCSFLYYIVQLLGGEENMRVILSRKDMGSLGKHPWLLGKCIDSWNHGDFLLNCKYGVLQYVVLKIFCAFLTVILHMAGVYDSGSFRLDRGYFYVSFIANLSQMWALYVLVKLYFAVEKDLKSPVNWNPVGKFMCIKGVVFFTWWQGVGIALLQSYGMIKERGTWAADDVADGLQDYLICVEMLFFSLAHMYTFSYKEYITLIHGGVDDGLLANDSYNFMTQALPEADSFRSALWNSSVPTEFTSDIKTHVFGKSGKRGRKKDGVTSGKGGAGGGNEIDQTGQTNIGESERGEGGDGGDNGFQEQEVLSI